MYLKRKKTLWGILQTQSPFPLLWERDWAIKESSTIPPNWTFMLVLVVRLSSYILKYLKLSYFYVLYNIYIYLYFTLFGIFC